MKQIFSTILLGFFLFIKVFATEGMWLPILLKSLNEKDMQSMGFKLTAEDLYSVNKSSLKDAVFLFGGGCTSEMVSDKGLLFTNHHCGYSQIQYHSSVENDYLKYGFWAKEMKDELANPGLTASKIVRIEDVTTDILGGVQADISESLRQQIVKANIEKVSKAAIEGTHYDAVVKPFFYGNNYYLIVSETFKDVRLVGAPPSFIGKYGYDTDNWMWPRHTGDFAVFRVYADKNNKPAEYSKDNKPYRPAHFFPISMKGIEKGDFTFVYGFPGRTQQYLTSYAINHIVNNLNPARIKMRETSLDIIGKTMRKSDALRIMYSAKQSRISNAYKKWIGENRGLKRLNAIERKQDMEKLFTEKLKTNPEWQKLYGNLLPAFKRLYDEYSDLDLASTYFIEFIFVGPEILRFANTFKKAADEYKISRNIENFKAANLERIEAIERYFKNYDIETDRQIFEELSKIFFANVSKELYPETGKSLNNFDSDLTKLTHELFSNSIFANGEKLLNLLQNFDDNAAQTLINDPGYKMMEDYYGTYYNKINKRLSGFNDRHEDLMAIYVRALKEVLPDYRKYYPDANSTLRVSYGKVEGYIPMDAVEYKHFTTIDGIIEKYIPNDEDFDLDARFRQLYKEKKFGKYGKNGTLNVAFVASNHTTGGNSGSPVLNADGHLIGINFDRTWESTMSDIVYDPEICRNISVDIRYVLWVIDIYADAGYLIKEMKLINK